MYTAELCRFTVHARVFKACERAERVAPTVFGEVGWHYSLRVTARLCLHVCVLYHVGSQVDAEDGDGAQRQWDVDQDEEQEGGDLRDVAGQSVCDGLFQIVKDQTACKDEGRV